MFRVEGLGFTREILGGPPISPQLQGLGSISHIPVSSRGVRASDFLQGLRLRGIRVWDLGCVVLGSGVRYPLV